MGAIKRSLEPSPVSLCMIELGLQTIHSKTAAFIRRGYELPVFEAAVMHLRAIQIPIIVHVILGLPKETLDVVYSLSKINSEIWAFVRGKFTLFNIYRTINL